MNQELRAITVTSDKLERNKFLVLLSAIAVIVCFALLQVASVFGQEASGSGDPVKKFNISFPISTLGNCESLEACKAYCEDVAHKDACEAFAKSKGFYKAPQGSGNARSKIVLEKAKSELGCDSEASCKVFCKEEVNQEKCKEFAKKYQLQGEKKAVNTQVLEKAKAALGCSDEQSCKALCQIEANKEKCSAFAKQVGLPGGMVKVGKDQAGFEEIKKLMERCQKDPLYCQQNIATIEAELFKKSDAFCKGNPQKCKEMMGQMKEASRGGKPMPNEKAFENANANARFCRENPEKCKNASGAANLKGRPPMPDKPKPSGEKLQFKEQFEIRDPQVQGVSKRPSFFEWLFNEFLR